MFKERSEVDLAGLSSPTKQAQAQHLSAGHKGLRVIQDDDNGDSQSFNIEQLLQNSNEFAT